MYVLDDLFQVAGCILYYIFSYGHHPFEEFFPYYSRPEKVILNMCEGIYKLIHCTAKVESVMQLIKLMIHKDPEKRPTVDVCLQSLGNLACFQCEVQCLSGQVAIMAASISTCVKISITEKRGNIRPTIWLIH